MRWPDGTTPTADELYDVAIATTPFLFELPEQRVALRGRVEANARRYRELAEMIEAAKGPAGRDFLAFQRRVVLVVVLFLGGAVVVGPAGELRAAGVFGGAGGVVLAAGLDFGEGFLSAADGVGGSARLAVYCGAFRGNPHAVRADSINRHRR